MNIAGISRNSLKVIGKVLNKEIVCNEQKYLQDIVQLQDGAGKRMAIISFKNAETGKLVQRKHWIEGDNTQYVTNYTWHNGDWSHYDTENLRTINPNAFKNKGLIKDITTSVDGEITSSTRIVVDIDKEHNAVTRAVGSVVITPEKRLYTSELTEKINGVVTKSIKQNAEAKNNELAQILSTETNGIDAIEHLDIYGDEYFFARFQRPDMFLESTRAHALKRQKTNTAIPLYITSDARILRPCYTHMADFKTGQQGYIIFPSKFMTKQKMFLSTILDHESRHAWQHYIIDDLQLGKLKGEEEIAFAKKLTEARKHYMHSSKVQTEAEIDKYNEQFIEADAISAQQRIGLFMQNTLKKFSNMFKYATHETLGA